MFQVGTILQTVIRGERCRKKAGRGGQDKYMADNKWLRVKRGWGEGGGGVDRQGGWKKARDVKIEGMRQKY